MKWPLCVFTLVAIAAAEAGAQRGHCPPPDWPVTRLEALKRDGFKVPDTVPRQDLAVSLLPCLADPNPLVRDGIAFEALSTWMRAGQLDRATLEALRVDLLRALGQPDRDGFLAPFAALVLSEIARTDRVAAWMSADQRDATVRGAVSYLTNVNDYRAFDDKAGFRHGVAHGADLALQLALNPATSKAQLDQLLLAVASQVAPAGNVAYWAGEPDRLARPVVFIAQRKLHSEDEWRKFFDAVSSPQPLRSWQAAFTSEVGIRKRHNVRAFLLSVYASASSSEDPGMRGLIGPVTAALKAVQ